MEGASCPWGFLAPQAYSFCERQLCGWVNQPANTFSNVGYLLVALWIYRSKTSDKGLRSFFSYSLFTLFLASTFFHGTGSVIGKMSDVSAMFIISMGILTVAVVRYLKWTDRRMILSFYTIGLIISLTFLFVFKFGNVLFMLELIIATILEILSHKRGESPVDKGYFLKSLLSMGLAMLIWWLDFKKILCWPDVHFFSGHGVWHLLTALALGLLFQAYINADKKRGL